MNQSLPRAISLALIWLSFVSAQAQFGENPNTHALRRQALKKYDLNANGKLEEAERESMRKARVEQSRRDLQSGRGRRFFQPPPEMVKQHDKDGDGQLSDEELQAAMDAMRKQWEELQKKYDRNGNGRMDPDEMETLQKEAEEGKVKGLPPWFPRRGGGRGFGGSGRQAGASQEELMKKMDEDGDGRLSAKELQALRVELERARGQPGGKARAETP